MPGYDLIKERDLKIYYINCFRSTARREKFQKMAKEIDLKATRIACFDGKKLTDSRICTLRKQQEVSPRADITPIELAINYSHRKAWERFLSSGKEYGLILEDDIRISKLFKTRVFKILNHLVAEKINFSILHLWNGNWARTKSKQRKVTTITPTIKVMQETVPYNAGGTGYIITRKFAQTLVDAQLPVKTAVDLFIGSLVKRGKHLTLNTTTLKNGCIKSPLIYIDCSGPYGTGKDTTQRYEVKTIDAVLCK